MGIKGNRNRRRERNTIKHNHCFSSPECMHSNQLHIYEMYLNFLYDNALTEFLVYVSKQMYAKIRNLPVQKSYLCAALIKEFVLKAFKN